MRIVAGDKHFRELNEEINTCPDAEIELDNVCGQRYICAGLSGKKVTIHGIPGNALCCYLDGCNVEVLGNAQDATGDTMNSGTLTIHGHCGDATGYAMRGGTILIEGNVGYRAGIHMKAYQTHIPVLVVGGEAGSFLGEYQAGGYIIVLGLNTRDHAPRWAFPRCWNARRQDIPAYRLRYAVRHSRAGTVPQSRRCGKGGNRTVRAAVRGKVRQECGGDSR